MDSYRKFGETTLLLANVEYIHEIVWNQGDKPYNLMSYEVGQWFNAQEIGYNYDGIWNVIFSGQFITGLATGGNNTYEFVI
jgi:hypothetical protein